MKKILVIIFLIISILLNSCVHVEQNENALYENNDLIGTWISYYEIFEIINSCDDLKSLEEKIINIVRILKQYGVNTIFLHVRAFDDALYKSDIFPLSIYCPVKEFDYDILKIFIEKCHKEDMRLHAWINPYRLSIETCKKNSFAIDLLNNDPIHLIQSEDILYYNPASSLVQNHIISGIKEILNNYDVDGIHFDDYFYPQVDFKDYLYENSGVSEKEFRTSAVNSLIGAVYKTVKKFNDEIVFSISPTGDIDKNINEYYADVFYWCNNDGFVDYIIPQIYYGFEHETMPFEDTVMEWLNIIENKNKLIVGLALYKCGEEDIYAGSGKNEWIDNSDIIQRQIGFLKTNGINSFSFYSASHIYNEL